VASRRSETAAAVVSPAGKGLWRQVPRAEREEQILTAAIELFTERGYPNVSMAAIAARTGITKPLIYSYFGSKEDLYSACIRRFIEPLEQTIIETVVTSLPPERRMWEGALVVFKWIGAHREGWKRFWLEPAAHGERAAATVEEFRERGVGQVAEMFWQGMKESGLPDALEPETTHQVRIFMGGVESLARWWVAHPDQASAELLATRLLNQAWMGFGDLLEGRLWTPPAD
jgi:AcrR family transcriptional regulator